MVQNFIFKLQNYTMIALPREILEEPDYAPAGLNFEARANR